MSEPKHPSWSLSRVFRHRVSIFALGAALAFPLGMAVTALRDRDRDEGRFTPSPTNRVPPAPIAGPESVDTIGQSKLQWKDDRPSEAPQKRSEAELLAVDRLLLTQQKNVEESRARMVNLMNRYKIVDLSGPREPLSELSELESLVAELEGLDGNDLIERVRGLNLEDRSISRLYPALQKKQADLAALLDSGLGEKHPEVVRLRLRSQQTLEILDRAADQSKSAIETRFKIARNRAGKGGEQQPEVIYDDSGTADETTDDERRKHIEFIEAKHDYEAQKGLLIHLREELVRKE